MQVAIDATLPSVVATSKTQLRYIRNEEGNSSSKVYISVHMQRTNKHSVRSYGSFSFAPFLVHLPLLNRFMTRPAGVVSKNDIGAFKIVFNVSANSCERKKGKKARNETSFWDSVTNPWQHSKEICKTDLSGSFQPQQHVKQHRKESSDYGYDVDQTIDSKKMKLALAIRCC